MIQDRFREHWGTIYCGNKVDGRAWGGVQGEAEDDDQGYWLEQLVKLHIPARFEKRKYNFRSKEDIIHMSMRRGFF